MEFTLYYRGELRASGGIEEKHRLRQHFHGQLRELWNQEPLLSHQSFLDFNPPSGEISVIREVGAFQFAPLVSSRMHFIADLEITLLRPEPPGSIISQGGDIDNRLKTLLDALKVPESNALPSRARPGSDQQPFFCLLEDDNLITGISVKTDRLLDPLARPSEVVLLLYVRARATTVLRGTLGLIG